MQTQPYAGQSDELGRAKLKCRFKEGKADFCAYASMVQPSPIVVGSWSASITSYQDRNEEGKMPFEIVLSVTYTADCLCVELAYVSSASYVRGYRVSPPTMDFTLGIGALHDNPSETYYWEAVRDTILRDMVINLHGHQPEKVLVLGDQSHNDKFRAVLEEAVLRYNGKLPNMFDEDPVFRVAKGAAEMARRRRFVL